MICPSGCELLVCVFFSDAGQLLERTNTSTDEPVAGRADPISNTEIDVEASTATRTVSADQRTFVTRDEFQRVMDEMVKLESRLDDLASTRDMQDRGLPRLKGAGNSTRSDPIIVVNIPPALFGMALVLAVISSMWDGMKCFLGLLWPLHLLVRLMEVVESLVEFRTNEQ